MADDLPVTDDAGTPSASAKQSQYEFTAAQNQVFSELSANLGFLGWFVIIVVVVFHAVILGRWAVQGVPPYDRFRFSHIVWPLLLVIAAWQFVVAARAFRKVVDTQGSDVGHLMDGLGVLNSAFSWLTIVPKVWAVVAVIAVIVGAVLGVIHLAGF
jgi:hypothetical protein